MRTVMLRGCICRTMLCAASYIQRVRRSRSTGVWTYGQVLQVPHAGMQQGGCATDIYESRYRSPGRVSLEYI